MFLSNFQVTVLARYQHFETFIHLLIYISLYLYLYVNLYSFICWNQVWFQNRRAKMRRQLKLQGQLAGANVKRDNDETSEEVSRSLKQQSESSDNEHWERRQEGENYPWTKAAGAALSLRMQPVTQKSGKWERPEGPSSEELRSCSIAKLRAKAREHVAEIHGTVNMSGGDTQSQTQEADAMHNH